LWRRSCVSVMSHSSRSNWVLTHEGFPHPRCLVCCRLGATPSDSTWPLQDHEPPTCYPTFHLWNAAWRILVSISDFQFLTRGAVYESRMCPHCITMAVTERRGGWSEAQLGTLNLGLSLEVGVRACAQANPSIGCDEFQNVANALEEISAECTECSPIRPLRSSSWTRSSNARASDVRWNQGRSTRATVSAAIQKLPVPVWRLPAPRGLLQEAALARRCGVGALAQAGVPRQANRWQTGTTYFQTRRTCLWGPIVQKADCEQLLSHCLCLSWVPGLDRRAVAVFMWQDSFWWNWIWSRDLPPFLQVSWGSVEREMQSQILATVAQGWWIHLGSLRRPRRRMSLCGTTSRTQTNLSWSHREGGILRDSRNTHLGLSTTERMAISCSTTRAQSPICACCRSFEGYSATSSQSFQRSGRRGISGCLWKRYAHILSVAFTCVVETLN
jgi:hypothetical protein